MQVENTHQSWLDLVSFRKAGYSVDRDFFILSSCLHYTETPLGGGEPVILTVGELGGGGWGGDIPWAWQASDTGCSEVHIST
jgi:hypothetical protein